MIYPRMAFYPVKCSIENLNTVKKFGTLEKSTAADGRITYRPKDGTRPNP